MLVFLINRMLIMYYQAFIFVSLYIIIRSYHLFIKFNIELSDSLNSKSSLTLQCLVVTRRSHILKQTCSFQVCVTFFLPTGFKGLIVFLFIFFFNFLFHICILLKVFADSINSCGQNLIILQRSMSNIHYLWVFCYVKNLYIPYYCKFLFQF